MRIIVFSELSVEAVGSLAATILAALSLGCIPLVLLRRKDPPTAFAWILVLIFLPFVGVILFWFFGRNRVRRPIRRKASSDLELRDRVAEMTPSLKEAMIEVHLESQPAVQRGVMRLAARMRDFKVLGGNRVEILVGAPDTYAAILQSIATAKHHVHLEYYIVRADAQGALFLQAMAEAAKRGVTVRFLYDAFGSRGLSRARLKALRQAGVHCRPFFPLDPIRRAWRLHLRNHRKIVVVDGEVGFMGGINIAEEFLPWRDVSLKLLGPAVAELQTTFLEDWYFATGQDVVEPEQFSEQTFAEGAVVQILDSGPDAPTEPIHRLYFAAIASAQTRVYITTPYFVPDRAILVALQTAALRGVEVRLMLPRDSNHRVTFYAGRSFYEELLESGVSIHEYRGMVHTKTMIIDGRFATVGSANLDVRSFRLNFETIAVLYESESVGRMERIFLEDLGHTDVVDLEEWRTRRLSTRIKEGASRLCSPLL